MFEYFTDRAVKTIMLAQQEARRLGHNLVGTEQILLGLIGEGTGVAATVLTDLGITLEKARKQVENIIGRGSGALQAELPFTPKAKRIFEQSFQEARQLGHNYIDTEHLLLAITHDKEGVAAKVMENLEVDPAKVRTQVMRTLGEVAAASTTVRQNPSFMGGATGNKATLEEFGTNLTQLAAEGKLDPVVGSPEGN
jgi:ATP-dependent Clp protease ATP-binding subunit ClpC